MVGQLLPKLRGSVLYKRSAYTILALFLWTGLSFAQVSTPDDAIEPGDTDAMTGSCPGAGNCCLANGSPGCDDASCCATVCATAPSCCDTEWGSGCASLALDLCGELCAGTCAPDCNKLNVECLNPGPRYDNRSFVGRILQGAGTIFKCTG